jgi:hypothetical protein
MIGCEQVFPTQLSECCGEFLIENRATSGRKAIHVSSNAPIPYFDVPAMIGSWENPLGIRRYRTALLVH